MAQFDYVDDRYGDYGQEDEAPVTAPPTRGARFGALVNWAGALMSLGILVGMSVWALQLLMRDVSGVPVIAAIEGPMREPPADPGGTQAPHQGLAVNRIAEGEEAQPVPDRLVLAPPPIELQEVRFETEAPVDLSPVPRTERAAAAPADAPDDGLDAATRSETTALIDRLLQEAQPGIAAPLETEDAIADEAPVLDLASTVTETGVRVLPTTVPGITRSIRPAARPVAFVTQAPARVGTTNASVTTEEIPVSDLPDGTRLVQLGAFDTAEIAREEWDRIATRFPDYFDARARVIEEAESGGQTFFRLRAAGFDDLAGSRRFCAVLVAQGTACIPVTVR
jgi:hypothetical protein